MWTQFMDMHSGGGSKEDFEYCYIEAPEEEAKVIFYNMFGHNPERVTCTCCGEDYSTTESETLEQATGYNRGCAYAYLRPDGTECEKDEACKSGVGMVEGYSYGYVERQCTKYSFSKKYMPLSEYLRNDGIKVIRSEEILDEHRTGDVPDEGYVWL